MCGIIGYTGKRQALPILLEGLSALEYRGYDSAGLTLLDKNDFITRKCSGHCLWINCMNVLPQKLLRDNNERRKKVLLLRRAVR